MAVKGVEEVLLNTVSRYPILQKNFTDIMDGFECLRKSYASGKKLLICGNGGSAADADHIVGELMKSFAIKRKLPQELKDKVKAVSSVDSNLLVENLVPALPAIALTSHSALNTAIANDVDPVLIFAQQVIGYGKEGDVLLCISTSGNSTNVIYAAVTAKALGLHTIGLTGEKGGQLNEHCDILIGVKGSDVAEIQELHLPVYHALCKMLELNFFNQ